MGVVTYPKIALLMGAPKYKYEFSKISSTGWAFLCVWRKSQLLDKLAQ